MEIPADCIAITTNHLTVEENIICDDHKIVKKSPITECILKKEKFVKENFDINDISDMDLPFPVIFTRSKVLNGEGKLLVLAVGENIFFKRVCKASKEKNFSKETPLQAKLKNLSNNLIRGGLQCSLIILMVLLMRFIIQRSQEESWDNNKHWSQLFSCFLIAVIELKN